jgi:hypothetical protein
MYGSFSTAKVELVKTGENVRIFYTNRGQSLFNRIINSSDIYTWWENVRDNFTEVYAITDGCVVISTYEFENISNIPVYFRISKPELANVAGVIFYMAVNPSDPDPSLIAEKNDYWYYLKTLNPPAVSGTGGERVVVEFFACIPQRITWADSLANWHAESIQATNNAVYLADGWNSVSGWLPVP